MKRTIIASVVAFLIGLSFPRNATAQGTITYLSNLGQTPVGGNTVGSDSWLAAGFITGANAAGYALDSVQLGLADASGLPGGFTVMVYARASFLGISPGSSLGDLTGSANPTTAGIYSYNASPGLSLAPSTDYFIVLTAGTAVSAGAYNWSYSGANDYNPVGGWISLGGGWTSVNGSSWNAASASFSRFAIYATPAPEPGVIGLFALGGLIVAFRRLKARPV
jgi:hypothetical protein